MGAGHSGALALGAQAVQIGTAFLGCAESGAPSVHREMLFQPEARDTQLTRKFSADGWCARSETGSWMT
jgi:nitronate monooxygenase